MQPINQKVKTRFSSEKKHAKLNLVQCCYESL